MDLFEEEELKFKTNRILDESHNLFTTTSSSTSSGIYCDELNNNEGNNRLIQNELNLSHEAHLLRHTSFPQTSDVIFEPIIDLNNQISPTNIILTIPSSSSATSDNLSTNNKKNNLKPTYNDDTDLDVSENLSNIDLLSTKENFFNSINNSDHFDLLNKIDFSPKKNRIKTKSNIKVIICKPNSKVNMRSNSKLNFKKIFKLKNSFNQKKFLNFLSKNFKIRNSNFIVNFLTSLVDIKKNNNKVSFSQLRNLDKLLFNIILFLFSLNSNKNTKMKKNQRKGKKGRKRTQSRISHNLDSISLSTTATSALIESTSSLHENCFKHAIEDDIVQDTDEKEESIIGEEEEKKYSIASKCQQNPPLLSRLNSVCSSANQNHLKIPVNIDDPCMFIDNLYNQLLNQPNQQIGNNDGLFDLANLKSLSRSTSTSSLLNDKQKSRLKSLLDFANLLNKTQAASSADKNEDKDSKADREVNGILTKALNDNESDVFNDKIDFDDNLNCIDWNFNNELEDELIKESLVKSRVDKCDLWMNRHFDLNKIDKISYTSLESPIIQWQSSKSTSISSLSRKQEDLNFMRRSTPHSPFNTAQSINYSRKSSLIEMLYNKKLSPRNSSCPNLLILNDKSNQINKKTTSTTNLINIFKRILLVSSSSTAQSQQDNNIIPAESSLIAPVNYFTLFFESFIKSLKFVIVTKNVFILPIVICLINALNDSNASRESSLLASEMTANTIVSLSKNAGSLTAQGLLLFHKK